jgi:tRNA A37 threonylcarbamoyladenosine dehydratase
MAKEATRLPQHFPLELGPRLETEDRDCNEYRLRRRYDRFTRLVGETNFERLWQSHIMIIGLGGVGGPAAECVVRCGVGRITLVDFDRICITNTNRQVQAFEGNYGRSKTEALAERLRLINPYARIDAVDTFYSAATAEELLALHPDFIIDAIDNMTAKSHLLDTCRARNLRVVTSLGASGRIDPTHVKCADLARTKLDPLGRVLRKILRQKYGFNRSGLFGITAVFSTELPRVPAALSYDGVAIPCVCPTVTGVDTEESGPRICGRNDLHSSDMRRLIYGTASFVTGTFGLYCASVAVRGLLDDSKAISENPSNNEQTLKPF